MSELVTVTIEMEQAWRYASGAAMERFGEGLKDCRIEAVRCRLCRRRYLPPRPFCGKCNIRMSNWTPVGDEGELVAWTVMQLPMLDGRTGEVREAPYGMGLIRLDGADTALNHYLAESDPAKLAIGQRVRAVWRKERRGAMDDIMHFEVIQ
jgi:hypothetical protein